LKSEEDYGSRWLPLFYDLGGESYMKKTLIVLLLLSLMGVGAFAQSTLFMPYLDSSMLDGMTFQPGIVKEDFAIRTPSGFLGVPSGEASGGRLGGWWGDIMDPGSVNGQGFDKWGGYVSFDPDFNKGNMMALAYGMNLGGGMYISAYYGGTGFSGMFNTSFKTEDTPSDLAKYKQLKSTDLLPTYNTDNEVTAISQRLTNDNRFGVLFGVADMGFRLSYASTYNSFNEKDLLFTDGNEAISRFKPGLSLSTGTQNLLVSDLSAETGVRQIDFRWAMAKTLVDGLGFKPAFQATIDIVSNNATADIANQEFDTLGANDPDPVTIFSQNYLQMAFALESGGITLATQDAFKFTTALNLALTLRSYDNEFSYEDEAKMKTVKFAGINYGSGVEDNRSYLSVGIKPSFAAGWADEKVSLSGQLVLSNTITSEGSSYLDNAKDKKETDTTEKFTYAFAPSLNLGGSYSFNERLTLYMGSKIDFATITSTKTTDVKKKYDSADPSLAVEKDITTETTELTFGAVSTGFKAGFSFAFTDNFILDALTGVNGFNGNKQNESASVVNDVLNFTRIMAIFKF